MRTCDDLYKYAASYRDHDPSHYSKLQASLECIDCRLINNVLETILLGLVPGTWFMGASGLPQPTSSGVPLLPMLSYSWSTLAKPALWGGVVAGVAMILAAIRLRRWRDEG